MIDHYFHLLVQVQAHSQAPSVLPCLDTSMVLEVEVQCPAREVIRTPEAACEIMTPEPGDSKILGCEGDGVPGLRDVQTPRLDYLMNPGSVRTPGSQCEKTPELEHQRTHTPEEAFIHGSELVRTPLSDDVKTSGSETIRTVGLNGGRGAGPQKETISWSEDIKTLQSEAMRTPQFEDVKIPQSEAVRTHWPEDVKTLESEELRLLEPADLRTFESEDVKILESLDVRTLESDGVRTLQSEDERTSKYKAVLTSGDEDERIPLLRTQSGAERPSSGNRTKDRGGRTPGTLAGCGGCGADTEMKEKSDASEAELSVLDEDRGQVRLWCVRRTLDKVDSMSATEDTVDGVWCSVDTDETVCCSLLDTAHTVSEGTHAGGRTLETAQIHYWEKTPLETLGPGFETPHNSLSIRTNLGDVTKSRIQEAKSRLLTLAARRHLVKVHSSVRYSHSQGEGCEGRRCGEGGRGGRLASLPYREPLTLVRELSHHSLVELPTFLSSLPVSLGSLSSLPASPPLPATPPCPPCPRYSSLSHRLRDYQLPAEKHPQEYRRSHLTIMWVAITFFTSCLLLVGIMLSVTSDYQDQAILAMLHQINRSRHHRGEGEQ